MPEEVEREHVRLGIETIERVAGVRPIGWMTGRPSANTDAFISISAAFSMIATRSTTNCPTGFRSAARAI
jgi:hypothetical protein